MVDKPKKKKLTRNEKARMKLKQKLWKRLKTDPDASCEWPGCPEKAHAHAALKLFEKEKDQQPEIVKEVTAPAAFCVRHFAYAEANLVVAIQEKGDKKGRYELQAPFDTLNLFTMAYRANQYADFIEMENAKKEEENKEAAK